ncbi:ADP-ribosylation/Crystallin J1 [Pseudocohnilembus persalinus]|uniref:ADP-ribosylation/Crystallin J1 n=1 Tax=Pseudocohnilembus persalinus TaxID=266149 RepID=A0A0V0R7Y0_PSEPJ|nr:ADP-ribosylation/Crystallin J1 [Pseudocohnilembus persalinus]|eukprot:KRX10587.1 ADP-ribosylation/Crystallin J1 [Pseudocohnilembus persalinus]
MEDKQERYKEKYNIKEFSQKIPGIQETIRKLKDDNSFENQWNSLIHYDIISENDEDRKQANTYFFQFQNNQYQDKMSRSIACFVGLAIGDSIGNITDGFKLSYERKDLQGFDSENYQKDLRLPLGMISDDTSLALCLADSFLENKLNIQKNQKFFNVQDFRHRILLWWYEGYNNGKWGYFKQFFGKKSEIAQNLPELKENVRGFWNADSFGVGITIWNSGINFVRRPFSEFCEEKMGNQNANGSLMRLAPVPILLRDQMELCLDVSYKQSLATHNGLQAAECCQVMSYLIIKLINCEIQLENNKDVQELLDQIFEQMSKDIEIQDEGVLCLIKSQQQLNFEKDEHNQVLEDVNWNWKSKVFQYSPTRTKRHEGTSIGAYCMDSLCMALHIIYQSENFEQCILKAVNLGGDADTLGAITGQIAGALFGICEKMKLWYEQIMKWEEQKVLIRAYKLFNKNKQ